MPGGDYKAQVRVRVSNVSDSVIDLILAEGVYPAGPELLDGKGNKFEALNAVSRLVNIDITDNNAITWDIVAVFHAQQGQGDPEALVLYESVPMNFTIPFTFENIPLE
jgi:hypothetical protein